MTTRFIFAIAPLSLAVMMLCPYVCFGKGAKGGKPSTPGASREGVYGNYDTLTECQGTCCENKPDVVTGCTACPANIYSTCPPGYYEGRQKGCGWFNAGCQTVCHYACQVCDEGCGCGKGSYCPPPSPEWQRPYHGEAPEWTKVGQWCRPVMDETTLKVTVWIPFPVTLMNWGPDNTWVLGMDHVDKIAMVKIKITGPSSYTWLGAAMRSKEGAVSCDRQSTFVTDCFDTAEEDYTESKLRVDSIRIQCGGSKPTGEAGPPEDAKNFVELPNYVFGKKTCDTRKKFCCELANYFGVVPTVTWGNANSIQKILYYQNYCHHNLGGKALTGCPYQCGDYCADEAACKREAERQGLQWGGSGNYYTKGCYTYDYTNTSWRGKMWWGTGGDAAAERQEAPAPKMRIKCYE